MAPRCTAKRGDGKPCSAWAVRGSDPPRCAAHGGAEAHSGVPGGNRNGPPDLDARIAALNRRIEQLEEHIDTHRHDLDAKEFAALVSLQGQLASRLGRLMRDRQHLQGDAADELQHDLDEALEVVSQVLGIDLTVST